MIRLVIQGRPLSKDNEKITNRQGRFFLSKKFKDYQKLVKQSVWLQMKQNGHRMLTEPLEVTMKFYFKDARTFDAFNGPKSIADACNGTLWVDDRQIKIGHVYLHIDKNERTEIEVEEIKKPT